MSRTAATPVSPTELSPERWSYEVDPDGEGTLLTESHEVTRPVGRIGLVIERLSARTTGAPTSAAASRTLDAQGAGRGAAPDRVGR